MLTWAIAYLINKRKIINADDMTSILIFAIVGDVLIMVFGALVIMK